MCADPVGRTIGLGVGDPMVLVGNFIKIGKISESFIRNKLK
jgi:hypothetical protein